MDIMQHTLAVIEGVNAGVTRRQPRGPAQRFLPVSTIEAAIDAVRSGLCFAWLPAYRIQSLLASGELLPLRMPAGGSRQVRLNLVCKDLSSSSRELVALAEMLGMNSEVEVI
jgi:DNA-binding transcriptional LysR family regulator